MTRLGFILVFGPAVLGLLILLLAAVFARTRVAVICWGVVAALLLGWECLFFFILPGVGGHAGAAPPAGWEYYQIPCFMLLGSVVFSWIYFAYGLRRIRKRSATA